jgi:hypothetical protein
MSIFGQRTVPRQVLATLHLIVAVPLLYLTQFQVISYHFDAPLWFDWCDSFPAPGYHGRRTTQCRNALLTVSLALASSDKRFKLTSACKVSTPVLVSL